MPGDPHGITSWMPTIADVMKIQGYATGQFGKNHLGDHDEHLPTNHGFDEFFGNLYHLNAEEEPEGYFYPKDPEFKKKYGPRGVLHTHADGKGGQKIEDTGPLNTKRMPTVDEEFLAAAQKFIDTSVKDRKPFFVWFNTTRMHVFTHLKPESLGKTGKGIHADGMVEHDGMVGQLLKQLDDLGIADNTIVLYTTDNGAEIALWPDGAMTPFRSEKGTTWEGGFRIPMMVRWPGVIKPGTVKNDIFASLDWLPTLVNIAGGPKGDGLKKQIEAGQYPGIVKTTLDGTDQRDYLEGKSQKSARDTFFYYSGKDPSAVRYKNWKMYFAMVSDAPAGFTVGVIPYHWTQVVNIKRDPFEISIGSQYKTLMGVGGAISSPSTAYQYDWNMLPIGQALWLKELETYVNYPPLQNPASYNLDQVMQQVKEMKASSHAGE